MRRSRFLTACLLRPQLLIIVAMIAVAAFSLQGQEPPAASADLEEVADLVLFKTVINGEAGTRLAAEWTLTASNVEDSYSSANPDDEVIEDKEAAYFFFEVNPGTYQLSESGPGGYTASDWYCEDLGNQTELVEDNGTVAHLDWTDVNPDVVTIEAGDYVACFIVNTYHPGPVCVDGDYVLPGEGITETGDCGPVRICLDGIESTTVTQFEYQQLRNDDSVDVSRGSCTPNETPPTVEPTAVPPTPAPTQEVEAAVATPTPVAVVEAITPPSTGDGGLSHSGNSSLFVAVAGAVGLLSLAALFLRRNDAGES